MKQLSPLTLTPAAEALVLETLAASGRARVLRIAFLYGCGGSGYRLSLESEPVEGDLQYAVGPLTLAIDVMAADELQGGVIDCVEGDEGLELILDHPNAIGAPLCGW